MSLHKSMTRTSEQWRAGWLAAAMLWVFSTSVFAYEIWYQDNSFARGRTLPIDFVYRFENPKSWAAARERLDVHMFRANVFRFPEFSDEFLDAKLIPQLRGDGIRVAIDTAGPLFSRCRDRSARFEFEFESMHRLKEKGVGVAYVSLQSIMSKPDQPVVGKECPLVDRIQGGIDYAKGFMAIHPGAEFGIIDALPSHGKPYREAYKLARDMFQKSGVPLGYIHLDISADQVIRGDHGLTWQKVVEVERYVKKLGLKFGIYLKSRRAGQTSDEAFYESSVKAMESYLAAGGDADHYVISSWFKHPTRTIRDPKLPGAQYPATDLIVEFSSRLQQAAPGQQRVR